MTRSVLRLFFSLCLFNELAYLLLLDFKIAFFLRIGFLSERNKYKKNKRKEKRKRKDFNGFRFLNFWGLVFHLIKWLKKLMNDHRDDDYDQIQLWRKFQVNDRTRSFKMIKLRFYFRRLDAKFAWYLIHSFLDTF